MASASPLVREALIAGLSRSDGTHAYAKWSGAFWRLISLVDLGVGPGHAGALAAAEETLAWVASPRRLAEIHERRIDGRVRRCASQDGRALQACLDVGLRGDPAAGHARRVARRDAVAGRRLELRSQATRHTLVVQRDLGPDHGSRPVWAMDAVGRGADFLLQHRVVFSHRTGEPAHPTIVKVHFPAYWHYDLLAGLRTLAAAGSLGDARSDDALDLLESKRRSDGTWRGQGRWWKRPDSKGSNVEVVDWGETADEMLTEQAEGVLRAAGRL